MKKKQRVQKQPNSESHYNQKKNAYIRTGLWIGLSPLQTPSTALCVWQGFSVFSLRKPKNIKERTLACFASKPSTFVKYWSIFLSKGYVSIPSSVLHNSTNFRFFFVCLFLSLLSCTYLGWWVIELCSGCGGFVCNGFLNLMVVLQYLAG